MFHREIGAGAASPVGHPGAGHARDEAGARPLILCFFAFERTSAVCGIAGYVGSCFNGLGRQEYPCPRDAHPHGDCSGSIVLVVHNGIIDNDVALRERLVATRHRFRSETNTEVLARLIEHKRGAGATRSTSSTPLASSAASIPRRIDFNRRAMAIACEAGLPLPSIVTTGDERKPWSARACRSRSATGAGPRGRSERRGGCQRGGQPPCMKVPFTLAPQLHSSTVPAHLRPRR